MMQALMTKEEILDYYSREFEDQPIGTNGVVNIKDIIIPVDFNKTHTNINKIRSAIRYYVSLHMLDKPISVIAETNENGKPNKLILVDEYARLLAARDWLGLKFVPVRYIDINTYCKEKNV